MIPRFINTILLLVLLSAPLFAADVSVEGKVDRNQITIGDRVTYTLSFAYPPSYALQQPQKAPEIGQWSVQDLRQTQEKKEQAITRLTYSLVTFSTGTVTIPAMTFTYTDDKGAIREVRSPAIPITVESVLSKMGDQGDIRDIKPPLFLKTPLSIYLLWLLGLALVVAGLYYWYTQYRKRGPALILQPAIPPVPPFQVALQALEALKNSSLVKEGRIKEFYIALSDIIRGYISAIYSFETRDRTTAELIAELRQREPDKKTLAAYRDFFDECDLVKFAKYRPEEKVCGEDWQKARDLIE